MAEPRSAAGRRATDSSEGFLEPQSGVRYPVVTVARQSVLADPFVLGLFQTISLIKEESANLAFENDRLSRRLRQLERRKSQTEEMVDSGRGSAGPAAFAARPAGPKKTSNSSGVGLTWAEPREQSTPRRQTLGIPSSAKSDPGKMRHTSPAIMTGNRSMRRSRTMRVNSTRLNSRSVREIVDAVPADTPTVLEIKF
eukprot:m.130236 g.130236  ORF g.130236 m.130236 type:complete len:197 (-) comp22368_c0_seq1:253-843(-)